jgi:hypothetical protein
MAKVTLRFRGDSMRILLDGKEIARGDFKKKDREQYSWVEVAIDQVARNLGAEVEYEG